MEQVPCNVETSIVDVAVYDQDNILFGLSITAEFLGSVSIALGESADGEKWYDLKWDEKFQDSQEEVSGQILINIQGISDHRKNEAQAEPEHALMGTIYASRFRAKFLQKQVLKKKNTDAEEAADAWYASSTTQPSTKKCKQ